MKLKRKIYTLFIMILVLSCNQVEDVEIASSKPEPVISERLGITLSKIDDGKFEIEYFDGNKLLITELVENGHAHHIVSGSRLENRTIGIIYSENSEYENEVINYYDYDNQQNISRAEFQFVVNGSLKSPCSKHVEDESFVSCFKREIDEFCDSIVSCVFLAANAKIVATIVAVHCVYCGNN